MNWKKGLMLIKDKSFLTKAISNDIAIWKFLMNFYVILNFQYKIWMARSFWVVMCGKFLCTCSHFLSLTWIWNWKFIESYRLEGKFYDTSVLWLFLQRLVTHGFPCWYLLVYDCHQIHLLPNSKVYISLGQEKGRLMRFRVLITRQWSCY